MKVGIDITPIIYEGTGVGTYTRELVRHLLQIDSDTHYLFFAATLRGRKKIDEFLDGLSIYANFSIKTYPLPPLVTEMVWNQWHSFPIEKLLGNVDVFHSWDWQQPPAEKAKLVTTIHDLTVLKFPEEHQAKTIAVHRRRLNWVKNEATAIIADSNATRLDIINLLNIDPAKIHTIYLAASQEYLNFNHQELTIRQQAISKVREKYNIKGDYILSVGTREPRKNLSSAIEAFGKLHNPNLSFVIIGRFGWGKKLTEIERSHTTGNIKILGFVEPQDLPALYAAAKVFVYPSLYEGFGLPIVESMSVGCPVVTSDRGSLKEVAGEAAVMVNPEDSDSIAAGIKTALGDTANSLINAGYKQAQKFSWEQTAKQTLAVYKSLID